MKTIHYLILFILFLSSCDKFDWHNPYDPECPKGLFTPSSPGATMEGNSVKLTWSQQNDDISGFALFRSAEGESISNLTQTQKSTTQYIDANFTPGKKYTYYVVAVAGTNKSDTVKAEIIPVIPITISTGAITELAATSAKVSGNITNAGGGTVTSRGICWSTNPNPTVNNSKTTEGTGVGQFTSTLTNLLAATTYYARAYGENSRGISYGSEITFTTLGPPKLTTIAVSNITATTATSGGTIISDGGSPITAKGVVWSTSPNPTIALATKTDDGTGVGAFTSTMSNLTNNTKYFFRAYATNIVGTSYSEEFSFTTIAPVTELLKQGLVAYYPFNGNANDESGNGNNGEINGAVLTNDRFGFTNKAYSLNGINNYIRIKSINMLKSEAMTISVWIKPLTITQNRYYTITRQEDPFPNFGYEWFLAFQEYGKILSFGLSTTSGADFELDIPINPNSFTDGQWHNITALYDGKNRYIYFDNTLIGFDSKIGSITFKNSLSAIGSTSGTLEEFFNGQIDDFRFYNRALTQEEITYLANN
jgi:hypothetical protein